jgi:glucosylceramidase
MHRKGEYHEEKSSQTSTTTTSSNIISTSSSTSSTISTSSSSSSSRSNNNNNDNSQLKSEISPQQGVPEASNGVLLINSDRTYQTIIGFGGAFTESSSINFFKLNTQQQDEIIDLYFRNEDVNEDVNELDLSEGESSSSSSSSIIKRIGGIGLNMGRIHINSCDFSNSSYTFDEVPFDYSLSHFDIEVSHDLINIIPFIKRAQLAAVQPLLLVASPWSPPGWMKVGNI